NAETLEPPATLAQPHTTGTVTRQPAVIILESPTNPLATVAQPTNPLATVTQPTNPLATVFPPDANEIVTGQPSAVTSHIDVTARASSGAPKGPSSSSSLENSRPPPSSSPGTTRRDTSIKSSSLTPPPPTTTVTAAKGSVNTSLTAGAKAGIAIGAIFGCLIVCMLCVLIYRKRRQSTTPQKAPPDSTASELDPRLDQPAIGELSDKNRSSNIAELDHTSIYEAPNDTKMADREAAKLSSATTEGNPETQSSPLSPRNTQDERYRLGRSLTMPMPLKPETEPVPKEKYPRSSLQDALASGSSDMDSVSLARLKEEEQRLEKEIATVERLANLRAQRDAVREQIRGMQNEKGH
ncbi:MAG: hypothetical protein Q9167_006429, partial [Letrouitia subvulpina]